MKHISYTLLDFMFSSDFSTFVISVFLRHVIQMDALLNQSLIVWPSEPHLCHWAPWTLTLKTSGRVLALLSGNKSLQGLQNSNPPVLDCRAHIQYLQVMFWLPGNKSSLQIGAQKTFGNGDICDRAINSYFSYIGKRVLTSRSAQGYNTPGDALL